MSTDAQVADALCICSELPADERPCLSCSCKRERGVEARPNAPAPERPVFALCSASHWQVTVRFTLGEAKGQGMQFSVLTSDPTGAEVWAIARARLLEAS